MAENRGEQPLRVGAGQRELIGMTDAGGLDLDQHFALARPVKLDGGDFQRLSGSDGNGGANVHGISSLQKVGFQVLEFQVLEFQVFGM
jgi:hypothetical protein